MLFGRSRAADRQRGALDLQRSIGGDTDAGLGPDQQAPEPDIGLIAALTLRVADETMESDAAPRIRHFKRHFTWRMQQPQADTGTYRRLSRIPRCNTYDGARPGERVGTTPTA